MWPTADELAAYMRTSISDDDQAAAEQALQLAIGLIRGETRQHIDYVEDDTISLTGSWGYDLWLPERPVHSVSAVTVGATTLDVPSYRVSSNGRLYRGPVSPTVSFQWDDVSEPWGGSNTLISVTYTHGYQEIPADLRAVCLSLAARRHSNPESLQSETIGSYSYTNQNSEGSSSMALLDDERAVCARYRIDVRSIAV
jgi:hypothetical protein